MAAGLTVARDRLSAVEAYFARELADAASAARARAGLDVDGALVPSGVTDGLMDLIERAVPMAREMRSQGSHFHPCE